MRLNARLSTHRNAHSLEVVDMETNQFYVENIYDLINMLSLYVCILTSPRFK